MGLFGKFFGKKDEMDFDKIASDFHADLANDPLKTPTDPSQFDAGKDQGAGFTPHIPPAQPPGLEPSAPIASAPVATPAQPVTPGRNHQLELINSKLDTIKALLQSLDQRVGHLESGSPQKKEKLW